MSKGGLASLDTVLYLVRVAMAKSNNNKFLIDGYPRELAQAFAFEKQVGACTFVLYFDVPDEVMIKRCISRGISSGRSDDNEVSIKNRVKVYHDQSRPAVDHYSKLDKVKKVTLLDSPEIVYKEVRNFFISEPSFIVLPEINFKPSSDCKIVFVLGGPGNDFITFSTSK